MRWLMEAWRAALTLRGRGVDIRAVTAWALLGSFNWNNLVTRETHSYEPGAFRLRNGVPEETDLAGLIRQLAHGRIPSDPRLETWGWWRQRNRLRNTADAAIAA